MSQRYVIYVVRVEALEYFQEDCELSILDILLLISRFALVTFTL